MAKATGKQVFLLSVILQPCRQVPLKRSSVMEMPAVNLATEPKNLMDDGKTSLDCSQCDYTSKVSSDLKNHMRVHSGDRPFACTQCDYSAKQNSHIKTHTQLKHSGQKSFSCDQCNYTCKLASNLKKHIHIHSAEKPFRCKQCNYSCTTRSHLTIHIRITDPFQRKAIQLHTL